MKNALTRPQMFALTRIKHEGGLLYREVALLDTPERFIRPSGAVEHAMIVRALPAIVPEVQFSALFTVNQPLPFSVASRSRE